MCLYDLRLRSGEFVLVAYEHILRFAMVASPISKGTHQEPVVFIEITAIK